MVLFVLIELAKTFQTLLFRYDIYLGMRSSAILIFLLVTFTASAQSDWPHIMETAKGGKIIMYQPQPESLQDGKLTGRAAVSVRENAGDEPIFGAIWYEAHMLTDRDTRMATMERIEITDVKLPGIEDAAKIERFTTFLESEIPKWDMEISLDDLLATIEQEQGNISDELKNDPPKVIYTTTPSTLVLIDGEPKLQSDEQLKMQRVLNTPFLILQSTEDKKYYLSAGKYWYVSSSIKEGWAVTTKLPKTIQELDKQIKKQDAPAGEGEEDKSPRAIIISTEPAELIQSRGESDFASIQGTSLLYLANSDDEIFMDINQQKYFVLLSGRWYEAPALKGPWNFIASDKLPADFQKIPEGSAKDNVLSSVAGTEAAKDAVMDAQIPQTAKVDRKTATCTVKYDGEPKFEKIEGTSMSLAMNTSSTVMQSGNKYFCVENGVWFESATAKGPWSVSTERPAEVNKIPASSTAYNTKYVYIYDTTPQYVYVGYTPGYMGCYVYGPTVVYGTGYYYSPWYGPYYYPRPVTYGFSMHYNPWTGWSMGFHYSVGFFHVGFGHGGYWGPPIYRPPYRPPYHYGGYYGRGTTINHYGNTNININRSNNIYNNRKDVTTRDVSRGDTRPRSTTPANTRNNQAADRSRPTQQPARPTQQPATRDAQRPQNNVLTDKQGNVYQKSNEGNWQQRNNNQWQNTNRNQPSVNQMDKQQQMRDRGNTRESSFNNNNRGGNMGGNVNRSSGATRPTPTRRR